MKGKIERSFDPGYSANIAKICRWPEILGTADANLSKYCSHDLGKH
jgi:hypothetical protein